jgi:hypothetical protein
MNLIRTGCIIGVFLVLINLILICSIPAFYGTIKEEKFSLLNLNDDILDQKQELYNGESIIRNGRLVAQEFKPSMTPLTKVIIKVRKSFVIEEPLIVSIRKNLDGLDLTALPIFGSDIPFFNFWVVFDFDDIEVNVEETYFIVVRSSSDQSFYWQTRQNGSNQGDPYDRGRLWQSNNNGIDWESLDTSSFFFDCTFKTYSYITKSDLLCEGTLIWTNITPHSVINGQFIVENDGTPFSYLNWEIYSWPYWGEWTFSSSSGIKLKPEDEPKIIQVSIKTPNVTNAEYSGKLKVINLDDEDDYCIIDCALTTPKPRLLNFYLLKFFDIFQFLQKYIKDIYIQNYRF